MNKNRTLFFFKNYFELFYIELPPKVQTKVLWTLKVIEELDRVPDNYLKHITNSTGLYEIRVQVGNNIFRIFCFYDSKDLIIIGHGFQKKTQKTPKQQIEKAEHIKSDYYESKK